MKILTLMIFMAISHQNFAQEFTITPLEEGLDFSSLDPEIKVKHVDELKNKKYLTPKKRDVVLYKTLGDRIEKMDEFDRDILYKSILFYSKERVLSKYPFMKSNEFIILKKQLQ